MEYPETRQTDFKAEIGTFCYEDPYIWLEDQQDPEVKKWTEAQNAYTDRWFDSSDVRQRMQKLKHAHSEEDCTVCAELGEEIFAVYTDCSGVRTARILTGSGGTVRILRPPADGDVMTIVPDPNGSGLAVFVMMEKDTSRFRFYLYDYRRETVLAETPDLGEICWGRNQRIWYGAEDKDGGFVIQYYDCNMRTSKEVYTLNRFAPYAVLRADTAGNYIIADCKAAYTSGELLQIDQNTLEVCSLSAGITAQFRYIGSKANRHYIMTDWNAPYGRILSSEAGQDLRHAEVVVPEGETVLLEAYLAGKYLFTCETEGMCARARLFDVQGRLQKEITLPSETGTYGWRIGTEQIFAEHACYFHFEGFDIPRCILRFSEAEADLSVWWQRKETPASPDIETEQFFVTNRSGERIPVAAVRKKGWRPDGKTPVLMTGYGGYRLVQPLPFQDPVTGIKPWQWAAEGGIYLCCGLRGGGEYGRNWHEAGCGASKKNAFYDFIDVAEWLVEAGWTSPKKLAACGASNGGLLITSVSALRPDLWACMIASVPHTDMVRFVNDAAGPGYATEYGDPREEDMAKYMHSYSPYHQAGKQSSPPLYLQTGERDPQVPSYHAKKLAAALQHAGKGGPVLLRTLKNGTHDRGSGEEYVQTIAEMQAFLAVMLGLKEE